MASELLEIVVTELAAIPNMFRAVFNCLGESGAGVSSASVDEEIDCSTLDRQSLELPITPAIPKLEMTETNKAMVSFNLFMLRQHWCSEIAGAS